MYISEEMELLFSSLARIDHLGGRWDSRRVMPKIYVRIPLDVKPEFAVEIDRAVAKLMLSTGERQTRTSFIQRAIRNEIDRMNAAEQSAERLG